MITKKAVQFVDDRLGTSGFARSALDKVFPDHWSFMLGEIALYCFVVLLGTGTFLTFFFKASSAEVLYHGSYLPLRNVPVSEAYRSVLNLSFDVLNGAEVVFGPAPRALPQLHIYTDGTGFLRAAGDFSEPVGPGFWNRPSGEQ